MNPLESATYFVSDIHLSESRPETVAAFQSFLREHAHNADAIYILGDCFDQWLGDDDKTPSYLSIVSELSALTDTGVAVGFMHGNHDFLIGESFAARSGCRLLPDPSVIDVYGTRVLVMHGDSLCTDDVEYQAFRKFSRDPENQRQFLALPMAARASRADALRMRSRELGPLKPKDLMDVNAQSVEAVMREHDVDYLVHGHTHRPAIHDVDMDGRPATRIVLGDWYDQDSVLRWDRNGYRLGRLQDSSVASGASPGT